MLDRREFNDAALAFEISGKPSKAMQAYEKAHAWRPLFTLAIQNQLDENKVKEISYRVAGELFYFGTELWVERETEDLCSRKRWAEAAVVYHDYASDIEATVRAYTNGNELSDALRIVRACC